MSRHHAVLIDLTNGGEKNVVLLRQINSGMHAIVNAGIFAITSKHMNIYIFLSFKTLNT